MWLSFTLNFGIVIYTGSFLFDIARNANDFFSFIERRIFIGAHRLVLSGLANRNIGCLAKSGF